MCLLRRCNLKPPDKNLTLDQINAIHSALRFLAALDNDGARQENGVGFNRDDTYGGHYLASQRYLSKEQAKYGLEIVWKYHRTQLPEDLVERMRGDELEVG